MIRCIAIPCRYESTTECSCFLPLYHTAIMRRRRRNKWTTPMDVYSFEKFNALFCELPRLPFVRQYVSLLLRFDGPNITGEDMTSPFLTCFPGIPDARFDARDTRCPSRCGKRTHKFFESAMYICKCCLLL